MSSDGEEAPDLNTAFIVVSDDENEQPTERENSAKRQRKRHTSGSSSQPSSIQAVSGEAAGPSQRKTSRIPRPVPISTEGESSSQESPSSSSTISSSSSTISASSSIPTLDISSDEPIITSVIEGDVDDDDGPVMLPNRAAGISWQLARNVQLRLYRRGWPSRVRRSHRPVVRARRPISRVATVQNLQSLLDTSQDADIAARMAIDPTYSPTHDNNTLQSSHEVIISELEASARRLTRPFTIRSLSPSYRRINMANPVDRHTSYASLRDRISELRRELQSLNGVLSHSYELLTQIAYQHRSPPPVVIDADFLQRAPTKLVTEADVSSEKQCSICLAHYESGETMRILPCEHEFHELCIDRWLTSCSRTCPFCRTNIQDALTVQQPPS